MSEDLDALQAREHLRAHREGTLIADELAEPIRFIIDSSTGRVVFPTTPAVAEARQLVLFVPEEDPGDRPELQLLLEAGPASAEACDRWHAYHGEPRLTRWLGCAVESARFAGQVVETDLMNQPNPLQQMETGLCRLLNADQQRLARLCQARSGVAVRDPRAVGMDDTGIDIRARFGIIRITLDRPASDAADAEQMIRTLLGQPET
jgi:hypothetical protein